MPWCLLCPSQVKTLAGSILALSSPSNVSNPAAETEAAKFAVRIHLFSLLFEVSINSKQFVVKKGLIDKWVGLSVKLHSFWVVSQHEPK